MANQKKLTMILFVIIFTLQISLANPLEKSLFDFNYLTYKFLEKSEFNHFNDGGPEMLVNKAKPAVGDEVRIALTDTEAKKNVEIILLSETEQKKFSFSELEGTGMFFEKIKITEKYEENLTFPFSPKKLLIFYKTTKPYVYQFGEEEVKAQQKEEKKKIEEQKKQEEQKLESQGQQISCDYYRSDEIEGFSDYTFIESTDPCEDLIITYKDQLFNKAKEVAKKECDKISCVRTGCNCQQYFQDFPYEESRMQCMRISGREQTRLSYTIEGACICKC